MQGIVNRVTLGVKDNVPINLQKRLNANLIIVQRGIITQSTDRSQLHQGVILGTFDWFAVIEPKQKPRCRQKVSNHQLC